MLGRWATYHYGVNQFSMIRVQKEAINEIINVLAGTC